MAFFALSRNKRAAWRPPPCSTVESAISKTAAGFASDRVQQGRGSMRPVGHGFRAMPPDIDADEEEQPHHVDEMPVPGGEFEAEMLRRGEMPGVSARQAYDQEVGSDQT